MVAWGCRRVEDCHPVVAWACLRVEDCPRAVELACLRVGDCPLVVVSACPLVAECLLAGPFPVLPAAASACLAVALGICPRGSRVAGAWSLLVVVFPGLPREALAALSPGVDRCPRVAEEFREEEPADCPVAEFPVVDCPEGAFPEGVSPAAAFPEVAAAFPVLLPALVSPVGLRSPVVAFPVVAFLGEASRVEALGACPAAEFLVGVRVEAEWC